MLSHSVAPRPPPRALKPKAVEVSPEVGAIGLVAPLPPAPTLIAYGAAVVSVVLVSINPPAPPPPPWYPPPPAPPPPRTSTEAVLVSPVNFHPPPELRTVRGNLTTEYGPTVEVSITDVNVGDPVVAKSVESVVPTTRL